MSGLHAYFRSSRPPKPRGLHAYFRQARGGDCQSKESSCALQEVVAESSDAEMTGQVQFVSSDSDDELMQPHKPTRTVNSRKSSLSVYAHDESLLHDCIQQQTYLVPRVNMELEGLTHPAEIKAARCLSNGRAPWSNLSDIMNDLPAAPKSRWSQEQLPAGMKAAKSFMTGTWSRGPHVGLMRNMRNFPLTSRLLAQIVSQVDGQHRFSSLTFACNVLSKPHKDSHNAKGSSNLIVPCSVYQGGELWVQDALGSTALQSAGQVGFLMDTTMPSQFQPEHQHATAPWGGDRLIIIGFHVRNTEKLSRMDRTALCDLGFQLQD